MEAPLGRCLPSPCPLPRHPPCLVLPWGSQPSPCPLSRPCRRHRWVVALEGWAGWSTTGCCISELLHMVVIMVNNSGLKGSAGRWGV